MMVPGKLLKPCILNAIYRKEELPEYENNPLIEALPRILTNDEWADVLTRTPKFHPTERNLDASLRQHLVFRLRELHQPLPESIKLASMFDEMIRQGYVHRNPATPDRAKVLQDMYMRVQKNEITHGSFTEINPMISSSLAGVSGMGKTTTVEIIADIYPQALYHPEYCIHQIVWMKVNCPNNGNPSQLAKAIIQEVDSIMDTSFYDELSSKPGDAELWRMLVHLAAVYSIGAIIIDEVQNLSAKRSGSWEIMLNFFQELCNQLKIPIMIMGTMKASKIYKYDFRMARRSSAVIAFVWDRLKFDEEWDLMLDSLWRYQWVRNPVPLTKEMSKTLYELSQGIIAVLTVMFLLAQRRAIETGEEELSESIFKRVMEKNLSPLHEMLAALRSGNPARLKNYEDLQPMDFEKVLTTEEHRMLMGTLKKASSRAIGKPSMEEKSVATLVTSGIPEAKAIALVSKAAEDGKCKTSASLTRRVLDSVAKEAGDTEKLSETDDEALDLRNIDGTDIEDMEKRGLVGDLPEGDEV